MVNLSKKKLDDYVFYRLYDVLFAVFITKRNYQEFNKFFISLFTPTERIVILKRIGIIYLILKKFSKAEICDFLKISATTYEKYYQTLDMNSETFSYYNSVIKSEKFVNTIEQVLNTIYGPGTPGINWSEAWKTKKKIAKRKEYGF